MEPIAIVAAALNSAKTGLDLIKALREKLKKKEPVNPADVADSLNQLEDYLRQAKDALYECRDDNTALRDKLGALERLLKEREDVEWQGDGGFWIRKSDKEKGVSIPYCPTCYG